MWTRSAGLLLVLWGGQLATGVAAQSTLHAATPEARRVAETIFLTLRPAPGFEPLAAQVARVLELRAGASVVVAGAPPPHLAEAVPADHVALVDGESGLRLVLGSWDGRSYQAGVRLDPAGDLKGDQAARSVALALEALRDLAVEDRRAQALAADGAAQPADGADRTPAPAQPYADVGPQEPPARQWRSAGFLTAVEPTVFAQIYSGASSASTGPQVGAAAGAGLCAVGHCVVLASALPVTASEATDVRYRYVTFSSTFYSRPFEFGPMTPGLGLGLLTRVGRFGADMGFDDAGIETDLAARLTVELAYRLLSYIDITAETGVDYAIDRWRVSDGRDTVVRGDRAAPWVQAGLRVQP